MVYNDIFIVKFPLWHLLQNVQRRANRILLDYNRDPFLCTNFKIWTIVISYHHWYLQLKCSLQSVTN